MSEPSGSESLLALLADEDLWKIFDDLADKTELQLAAILRPHDEARLTSARDGAAIRQRDRLDQALGALTMLEIGNEIGLLQGGELQLEKRVLRMQTSFRKLVMGSEAFFRYASAYLYFGVRILAYRWFGPGWLDAQQPSPHHGEPTNRRLFPLAFPPPLVIPPEEPAENEGMFERFLNEQTNEQWTVALRFLDGFHPGADLVERTAGEEASANSPLQEPALYELWLRGLLPNAETIQSDRFQQISDGLVAWVRSRTDFYLSLQKTDFLAAGEALVKGSSEPLGDGVLSNPLTARFALADIYWLARVLRAEVSTNASVSYSRVSWLNLLSFKAALDGKSDAYIKDLTRFEDTLRAVFNFVCDLVQNAVALTGQRECRHFNPGDYPRAAEGTVQVKRTKHWRSVFDEELREIDRQRSRRTYTPSTFPPDEPFSMNAEDADAYWSERLITGRQPYNRIGVSFSGGGIRSATFNLGILQGLQELDLLRHVDYLSTVSGGGFIGSWLIGNVRRTRQWLGRATCWDESIAHLRSYSSYLAPITGLLSPDTWTLAASWARNAFLIQLTGITWLFALLLGGLGGRMVFLGFAHGYPKAGLALPSTWPWPNLPYAGILAMVMGLLVTGSLIYNFTDNRVETGKHSPRAFWIRYLAILPCWVGGFVVAAMLWSNARLWSGTHDFSFLLERAWHQFDVLLATHWIALLLIGLFALRPSDSVKRSEGAGRSAWSWAVTVWRSLWIGTLCVAVLYLGLCAILYLNLNWVAAEGRFESYDFVFGPAFVLAAFALSVVIFIGLSGRASNEAQREWWTRFGAWLLIYGAAGLALSGAAVLGPRLVIKVFTAGPPRGRGQLAGAPSWVG